MVYFIFWVVFILVVLLAVPVAAFLDKRRHAAANPAPAPEMDADGDAMESMDQEGDPEPAEDDDGFGTDPAADFEEIPASGGDDFSAFEDEFK